MKINVSITKKVKEIPEMTASQAAEGIKMLEKKIK